MARAKYWDYPVCQKHTVSKHRYQPDWWRKRPFTVNYPFEDSFAFALLFE
jgi:hypothetical protein